MAFARVMVLFALLLIQPLLSTSDDICRNVDCGKGRCALSTSNPNEFECQCNQGWKRTYGDNETGLEFLPCVVPNCTMNYTCSNAPTPAPVSPSKEVISKSIFDVCHWVQCGAGSCVRISLFHHKCECEVGYGNLLNTTNLPCVKECSFGLDCAAIGLSVNSSTTSSLPSEASLILRGNSLWLVMLIMVMANIYLQ